MVIAPQVNMKGNNGARLSVMAQKIGRWCMVYGIGLNDNGRSLPFTLHHKPHTIDPIPNALSPAPCASDL
jgi:hypothetical protein